MSAGRRREKRRGAALVVALVLASSTGCKLPGEMVVDPLEGATAVDPSLPREQLEALEQLRLAVVDGEHFVARGILIGILSRDPAPEIVRAADAYRRILDGRECIERLDLRLTTGPGELEGHTRVELLARSELDRAAVLHMLPPTLVRQVYAVSPLGIESRNRRGEVRTDLVQFELAPGSESVWFLGEFPRTVNGALAVRETFDLRPGGAWLELGGELLPAQDLAVVESERTSVAGFLPLAPVQPGEVAAYVGDDRVLELPDEIFLPALLERAVRVAPSRRSEAIDLLAAAVVDWSDDQVAAASPALRWLTDAVTPGSDPHAWRAFLAGWARPVGPDGAAALVLPR